ncbi:MAG: triose-phosphate isomerase [Acetobacter sp.]|nr:triose-phosphate isomerase [Acetobacter sp.]
MKPQIIVGNWKMNGTKETVQEMAQALTMYCATLSHDQTENTTHIVICPPFTLLPLLSEHLKETPFFLGAQNCHEKLSGPYTGDISANMLLEFGVSHVILGHSERRQNHGELDGTIRGKVVTATKAGLTPIVCIGETREQRETDNYTDVLGWQIEGSLPNDFTGILAYEPIWAIGTGLTASIEQITETMCFLQEELIRQFGEVGKKIPILYGGSVTTENATAILSIPEVSGILVGGQSLNADTFLSIIQCHCHAH